MVAATQHTSADYDELAVQLQQATGKRIYSAIVSAPFEDELNTAQLYLGFICLYLVDEKTKRIWLMSNTNSEEFRRAIDKFKFKPTDYYLEFDKNKDNTIVQALVTGQPQHTADWATLNRGDTPVEMVRLNQANSGIAYTCVHPFTSGPRGALMYNFYQYPDKIGASQEEFMTRYTELVAKCLTKPTNS